MRKLDFDAVYYEPAVLGYPLGRQLRAQFENLPWIEIESHNRIPELSGAPNRDFPRLKRHLIVGVRKTHRYAPNQKVSDYLVPYTSSGCRAMCLYCYLVCHYNKCAYLRLFVNREEMLDRLLRFDVKTQKPCCYEIGSNSDLVLENEVTGNLAWTIERFAKEGRGKLTFPTKFDWIEPLLGLDHRGKTVFRMSVNPEEIIGRIELGTAGLDARVRALNEMCRAGYPVGLLIAPVILLENWKAAYGRLIEYLAEALSEEVKRAGFIEIILMTYSYVHNAVNTAAFPSAPSPYDPRLMTGRGRGRYAYRPEARRGAEAFLRAKLSECLGEMPVLYIS